MYEGNTASLQMERMLMIDGNFDEGTYRCYVRRFDPEEDYIHLELVEKKLENISLDAKYRCTVATRNETIHCTGIVKERYRQDDKNMIRFKVDNGFFEGDGSVTEMFSASPPM